MQTYGSSPMDVRNQILTPMPVFYPIYPVQPGMNIQPIQAGFPMQNFIPNTMQSFQNGAQPFHNYAQPIQNGMNILQDGTQFDSHTRQHGTQNHGAQNRVHPQGDGMKGVQGDRGIMKESPSMGMLKGWQGEALEQEKRKYESSKHLRNKKGYQSYDSRNIFSRNMIDLQESKSKQTHYAEQLEQQLRQKRDLLYEKKILETRHDLAQRVERQKNSGLFTQNMPSRDKYGNILNSRNNPGNKNYELEDWFTHLPNIDNRYLNTDEPNISNSPIHFPSYLYDTIQDTNNLYNTNNIYHANSLQNTNNIQNTNTNNIQNTNTNNIQNTSTLNNTNSLQNTNNNINFHNQSNQSNNHLSNYSNIQHDNPDEILQNVEEEEEDNIKKVRIMTPTKIKRTTKGTQTPHNGDELSNLTNQQIGDLYPNLVNNTQEFDQNNYASPQNGPNESQMSNLSFTQMNNSTAASMRVPTAAGRSQSQVRFTSLLKGTNKYANEDEKMAKREQYIQLQKHQLAQIQDKKNKQELNRIQLLRENELEELRLKGDRAFNENKDISNQFHKKQAVSMSNPFLNTQNSITFEDVPSQTFSQIPQSTSNIRDRTTFQDSNNTYSGPEKRYHQTRQLILKEIPLKVRQQVGEIVSSEGKKLANEFQVQKGEIFEELKKLRESVQQTQKRRTEQVQNMNEFQNEINVTRMIDDIRRREISDKLRQKEEIKESLRNQELTQAFLQNQVFEKKKYNLDDQFDQTPDQIKEEIGAIIRDGEMPVRQPRNRPNYINYDDNFTKTSQEIFTNQQTRIEERLAEMGLSSLKKPRSPNISNRQISLNNSRIYDKNVHLPEINQLHSDPDDIYKDLIKGNIDNSKIFKIKRDHNALMNIQDYARWNSSNPHIS